LFDTTLTNEEKTITIYTVNGQLVKTFLTKSDTYTANISNIPAGLYFIKIESKAYSYTYKFAKQ